MNKILEFLNKSLGVYDVRGVEFEPTYWQAGVILLLVFMLVFSLARVRYLYVHWSLGRSAWSMLFWGFVLALVLEGFLIISGRTLFTEVLGWEKAPKPISTILAISRNKLVDVLGVTEEATTYQTVIADFSELSEEDMEKAKDSICTP
jgi:hypothetical protein